VYPRTGLDDVEERKFLTFRDSKSDPSVVESVASRYADYSTCDPQIESSLKMNIFVCVINQLYVEDVCEIGFYDKSPHERSFFPCEQLSVWVFFV
jgi:hypothetical protein